MDDQDRTTRAVRYHADGSRTHRMRWQTLAVVPVSLLIINVAAPALHRELGASATALQWIADVYILVFAGLFLSVGALGDRFGRKRFLQLGLLLFAGASVFAAYAGSASQLIAARALMGVGGAMIMPSALSVLIDVFPRRERRIAAAAVTGLLECGS
jgi:MFS transporter, DHA2 family, multidrug resistance protein